MVAASKLKRAQDELLSFSPYFSELDVIKNRLLKSYHQRIEHPLIDTKSENPSIICLVFTSDTGLCGSYNTDIIRYAEGFLREYSKENIRLVLLGKKGENFFKKRDYSTLFIPLEMSYIIKDRARIVSLSEELIKLRLEDTCKEIWLFYTQYISFTSFKPTVDKLLPILTDGGEEQGIKKGIEYIFEPGIERILDYLLPEFILHKLWYALLNSFTSEESARMIAMKSATDNAEDMLNELTLVRNKVRQASITKELSEVVATSEALK